MPAGRIEHDGSGLPSCGGTYVLVMHMPAARAVAAGRLGERALAAGWYLYVGSAFGPGGLAARCARHERSLKPTRWHVDYLRYCAALREIWYRRGPQRLEHAWAGVLEGWAGSKVAWPRFGASDCGCPSHLWYRSARPGLSAFRRAAADDRIQGLVLKADGR